MWFKNTYRFSPFYKRILDKGPFIKVPKESLFKDNVRIKFNNELLKIKKPNILGIKTTLNQHKDYGEKY